MRFYDLDCDFDNHACSCSNIIEQKLQKQIWKNWFLVDLKYHQWKERPISFNLKLCIWYWYRPRWAYATVCGIWDNNHFLLFKGIENHWKKKPIYGETSPPNMFKLKRYAINDIMGRSIICILSWNRAIKNYMVFTNQITLGNHCLQILWLIWLWSWHKDNWISITTNLSYLAAWISDTN